MPRQRGTPPSLETQSEQLRAVLDVGRPFEESPLDDFPLDPTLEPDKARRILNEK